MTFPGSLPDDISVALSMPAALPLAVKLLFALWVGTMISVPILRWVLGPGAERVGISLGVVTQAAAVSGILISAFPWLHSVSIIVLVPVGGFLAEFVGSRTGLPFGRYHYTDVLQPQVGRVPVVIPLAWLMMLPPSWAVAAFITGSHASPLIHALLAGGAFAAWDLFLDPQMVRWDFWRWERHGRYFGIPAVNFLGWFLVGAAITLLLGAVAGNAAVLNAAHEVALPDGVVPAAGASGTALPLLAVYVITWLLETIGQLFFWNLRGSAVAGFAGMGLFLAVALV